MDFHLSYTPFCVKNAQMATLPSLIYAHFVGVLNEKRCNNCLDHPVTHDRGPISNKIEPGFISIPTTKRVEIK